MIPSNRQNDHYVKVETDGGDGSYNDYDDDNDADEFMIVMITAT